MDEADLTLGEEVYRDDTNTFKIVYGGHHKHPDHGFVTYVKYRTHWKRIDRNRTYLIAITCIRDFKERLGL